VPHQTIEEVTTDARLRVWLASQRSDQHLLVQCPRRRFEAIGAQVRIFAAGPVRHLVLPGDLDLPADRTGTLLVYDIAALQLPQQISLFDWIGPRPGRPDVRLVALTAEPLDRLVERGAFLEGLLHRLGPVQLNLTAAPAADRLARAARARNVSEFSNQEKAVCVDRMYVER
jgi:sigma-54-interacting transcriptional regulator